MATRHFRPTEPKNSRIQWERADPETTRRLALAVNRYSHGLVTARAARVLVFLPGLVPLALLGFLVYAFGGLDLAAAPVPQLVFCAVYGGAIAYFSVFLAVRYLRFRPHLYPERQPHIWVFRAVCARTWRSGSGSDEQHCAHFPTQGRIQISLPVTAWEYKNDPTGKEYVFYKFSARTGDRWRAVPAAQLEEFG